LLNVSSQFQDIAVFPKIFMKFKIADLHDVTSESQSRCRDADEFTFREGGISGGLLWLVWREGLFPHQRSILDKEQMEEERQLCYVRYYAR
jgi:hypothetical protein